jgi:hypothetical protein
MIYNINYGIVLKKFAVAATLFRTVTSPAIPPSAKPNLPEKRYKENV